MALLNDRTGLVRSNNPALNGKTFASLPRPAFGEERMTVQGTINKSFLMLVVLLAAAFWTWSQYLSSGNPAAVTVPMTVGIFAGFVLSMIMIFKGTLAPYLALPYAVCEGLALGGFSAMLERRYPGIAIQAVGLTFGVFGGHTAGLQDGLHPCHAALPHDRGRGPRRDHAVAGRIVATQHVPCRDTVSIQLEPVEHGHLTGHHRLYGLQPGIELRHDRSGRGPRAHRDTWSGTAPSAYCSRW